MPTVLKSLILAVFIALVSSLSFLAGYGAAQRPIVAAATISQAPPTADLSERFKVFWEAWGWVEREYYDHDGVDATRMTYGAIRGMLQSLGDPHTYFVDPQERAVSETRLQGGFEGIGVTVEMKSDGKLRVVAPQEGSPGENAGVRPGDVITHVDGKPVAGLTLVEAVSLIRGPSGTTVTLTLEREGATEPLILPVTRAPIKVETVRATMRDQGVAYVRISQFGAQTARELTGGLQTVLEQKPRGLILDLRANPGGYLTSAVDVASQFLQEGVVLYEVRSGGDRQEFRVKRGGLATSIKMVVLVDKGTASASEIVAGALQDYQRAPLVGEKTYGKGSMQSVHNLSDGSSIHVTIARWLTPKERPINGTGLTPDVAVGWPVEGAPGSDVQLDRATEILLGDGS